MFRRILVANRGEIALRIIRACEELDIETVAVYSTADAACLHVERATHKVCIGPPDPRRSYLSIPSLIAAAKNSRCEAVHPGYGFLAESASFAEACEANGLIFIGPPAESIRALGDKSLAKQLMADAGLPIVPGSPGPVADVAEALAWAEQVGYPVMLKAAAGGGGRGMRRVETAAELERGIQAGKAAVQQAGRQWLKALMVGDTVKPPEGVRPAVRAGGGAAGSPGVIPLPEALPAPKVRTIRIVGAEDGPKEIQYTAAGHSSR